MSKPILCVDFDGVIHSYASGWQGAGAIVDPPVPGALRWLYEAQKFWSVHVYSSRSKEKDGRRAMLEYMTECAIKELLEDQVEDFIKNITFSAEKPAAMLTIDDRAVCFNGDWGDPALNPFRLLDFRPWYKRDAPRHGGPRLNERGDVEINFGWNTTTVSWSPEAAISVAEEMLKLAKSVVKA